MREGPGWSGDGQRLPRSAVVDLGSNSVRLVVFEGRGRNPLTIFNEKAVLGLIPSPNLMYAIRIDGRFSHVRARSVPKMMNYMPLAEIAKLQTVFEFKDVEGTIVGFYTPSFLSGVHLAGLHLHFITADRKRGGHLLAAAANGVTVGLQHAPSIELGLPMTLDFLTMERTRDMQADLDKVER